MSDQNQKQPENQPLGQSISEIIDRTTTIVHEEIELAKAELAVSLQNLLRGSVAGIVGGVFAFFGLFVLLIGLSFLISDLIDFGLWPGFLIVAFFLFVFGGILAWVALKKIKKGSQLVPTQAIAEAKATQAALQPEPEAQQFESVAVEEPTGTTKESPAVESAAAKPAAEAPADATAAEAADLLAAAKEVVEKPQEAPAPTFVTERTDLPFAEGEKSAKAAAKDEAKAAKAAAKKQAKAEKEAAKAMKAAEKEAAKARKATDKAVKKAGGAVEPTEGGTPDDNAPKDDTDGGDS